MENIKENVIKIFESKEWDKLKNKVVKGVYKIRDFTSKNRFITAVGILFVLFSTINIMLISYFMQVLRLVWVNFV
mgnify:FL=1